MNARPAIPRPGEKISASWFAAFMRYVESRLPLQGPGTRFAQGPNGTVITATAAPTKSTAVAERGCFRLAYREGGSDGEAYLTVVNRYWSDGEICAHIDEEDTINLTDMAAVEELPMIALKVPAAGQTASAEVVGYANFESMVLAQHDQAFAIQPLYLLKVTWPEEEEEESNNSSDSTEEPKPIISVECDFRNIPKLQLAELL